MQENQPDIIIYGAGIAGLWTLNKLRGLGYDALLLEKHAVGGVQTIASQGILHSGLKYAMTGKVNALARSISKMPEIWREALTEDLSGAVVAADSQYLLIPPGIMGEAVKMAAKQLVGKEIETPEFLRNAGFGGSVIHMGEPVLDIPSVVRALGDKHKGYIKKIPGEALKAKVYIYTAAGGNVCAGIQMQERPLLMGLIRNAPFPLWAHFVGASEKPVATITTHTARDGSLIWYVGGQVAEREKDAEPMEVYIAMHEAFRKYLPGVSLSDTKWSCFPVDRVEAKGSGFMPDAPTVHCDGNRIYAWPTKLTFAPLMADMIAAKLEIAPSRARSDWSFLDDVNYADPPWEMVEWKKGN